MAKKKAAATKEKSVRKTGGRTQGVQVTRPKSVTFDYIKSNVFRVIHVDGAHGGIAGKVNKIQMALYSERQAIPQQETYAIKKGKLDESSREKTGRTAVIREVEVEAIMDVDTAKALRDWLDDTIRLVDTIKLQTK